MTTEELYQKYIKAMQQATGDGAWIDWGVVRLGLRLAIAEAFDAAPAIGRDLAAIIASQDKEIERMIAERAVFAAQFVRLNEWLEENAPAQYHNLANDTATGVLNVLADQKEAIDQVYEQLAQIDADNAGLLRRCAGLETELAEVKEFRDHLHDELAALALPPAAAIHTNGNGNGSRPTPTDWHVFLDEEANDWRISLDAGRRRFADVPKLARLHIIQAILRGTQIDTGNTSAMPSMADYDAIRPQWAPGSTSLTKTFACAWREILTLAEVAA